MSLRKRLDLIEAQRGANTPAGPSVIFLCNGETGEPMSAFLMGGGSIKRETCESRQAFEERARAGLPTAIHRPQNGRYRLTTGDNP